MKQFILVFATIFGIFSIVLGALSAHVISKLISTQKIYSLETGTRYMMFHALVLLILGFQWNFQYTLEKVVVIGMIVGVILFSGSIIFLSVNEITKINFTYLGPITPLGGAVLIGAWIILLIQFIQKTKNLI